MVREASAVAKIFLFCILAAIGYGIMHDQVTARVCVEYFTIGHEPIIASKSPTQLGLIWGVTATWWVGFLLAWPLSIATRWGTRPRLDVGHLRRPVFILLIVMSLLAVFAGLIGRNLAMHGHIVLTEPLASRVPRNHHAAFIADTFAHSTSYLVGFIGGIVVIVSCWWKRRMLAAGIPIQVHRRNGGQ